MVPVHTIDSRLILLRGPIIVKDMLSAAKGLFSILINYLIFRICDLILSALASLCSLELSAG
ncbi:Uncharacterised protein [Vibrio cholerae]|nr:Uncharacterised protein [Vibrio cholerae]